VKSFFLLLICLLVIATTVFAQQDVWVNGYYRKDGTYVEGYYRTAPNSTKYDNYSTQGNINPYTGKPGWINPDGTYNYSNTNNSGTPGYSGSIIGGYTIYAPPSAVVPYYYYDYNNSNSISLLEWTYRTLTLKSNGYYSSSFLRGVYDAKTKVKVRKYIFWSSFVSTAIFPPVGAGVSLATNFVRKKIQVEGDADYVRGFKKRTRRKIFWKSFAGFSLGLITNLAVDIIVIRRL
jgi:hypothetical protein